MDCPYCDFNDTKVYDSRDGKDGSFIKRRRECTKCSKRFTTVEKILKLDLEVKKTSGEVEVFSLQKIRKSLLKACEKRPVTLEKIENLISLVLSDLKKENSSCIPTFLVGQIILKYLRKIDEIAFLKFAIVYNNYKSIEEFTKDLEQLKDSKLVQN